MPDTLAALDYLAEKKPHPLVPIIVVSGDEPFLKRLVLQRLRAELLPDDEADFSLAQLDGDECEWRDVNDELSTVALFGGGQRIVIVRDADDFVSKHRGQLEDFVAKPKSTGMLILDVTSWPSNTRLYKAVNTTGQTIDCGTPKEPTIIKWATQWAKTEYQAKLDRPAAEQLLSIIGPQLGRIDQELAKLAARVGPDGSISADLVDDMVGGWRAKQTWDMLDAALAGNAREALTQLDKLILSGEDPIGLLAQMSGSMRRLAAAARLYEQGERTGRRTSLRQALETVGVKGFVLGKTEEQLKQVGRQRATQLYRWLIDTDLALKGTASQKHRARFMMEQLVCKLSTTADPRKAK
ncbi:MAG: DNA polymerase III subunit delta [Planctomycetaceae bacterium]|nr:DNA polymerase III subunit delta [Planctomycetaceae bacterium]